MGIGNNNHHTYYYRSPLIMRNEKPPMPAPPEYTRQTGTLPHNATSTTNKQIISSPVSSPYYHHPVQSSANFLNEIKAMLTQEKIGESSDESIQMLIHNNYNYPTDLPSYKSSSSSESPQPLLDADDQTQLIYKPSQAHQIPLISLKEVVSSSAASRRSESVGRITSTTTPLASNVLTANQMNSFNQLNLQQQQQLKKLLP